MKISISATKELHLDKDDLKELKQNPEDFADSLYLSDLVALLKTANTAYHTSGKSQLTDKQYDFLLEELRSRKPSHPLLQQIGAPVQVKTRAKVKLPYPLFSLDKVKPGEASYTKWQVSHEGPYVISDKEDGLSLEVIYEKGIPTAAYTRGDGLVGQDVTHLISKLSIPMSIPVKTTFAVRMEVIMSEEVFNAKFSKHTEVQGKYDNPRNLVAGIVNTIKKNHEALDHVHHIAYEILTPRMKPSEALALLKSYKFNVVPHVIKETITEAFLTKYLAQRKLKSNVAIDGLVVEQDKKTKRSSTSNPDYAVAFKVTTEDDTVIATVKEVVWTASKYGVLKPVVHLEPIRVGGVTVKKASGFNAFFIENGCKKGDVTSKKKPIGPGALVKLTRSGDVIPYIMEVVKAAKLPDMPDLDYDYTDTGVDIRLVDSESDYTVQDKRITSFFTTLGIDFIKEKTVARLAEAGLDSVISILKATPEDFLEVEGFKETTANKLYKAIKDKTSSPIPLATLMKASGIFDSGMGERRLLAILNERPDILQIFSKEGPDICLELVKSISGFQTKTAKVFVDGLPKFIKWLKASGLKTIAKEEVVTTSNKLKNLHVAFTGFRNKDLEEQIKFNSGVVDSGVTKLTNVLLVASKNSTSSKVAKAQQQGVSILTVDEFLKKFKL